MVKRREKPEYLSQNIEKKMFTPRKRNKNIFSYTYTSFATRCPCRP